ncbi:MAG: hypothetical protein IAE77_08750 [Prosthecobacter sp.]|jgi:hypothetical protein|uniref:hypothetical protein n=1 Tax=Prosthecobacter sp. TaxID=1965333 RepID=UPI001A0B10FD|nr:hypothetical protein [Prosthecobacter sp.]MBE2283539.1 hypothetical protein [Prosthecobacter sp.]
MNPLHIVSWMTVMIMVGCGSRPQSGHHTSELDYDNRPLPADRQNLHLQGPATTIRVQVPAGWQIQSQPYFNSPSYTLALLGSPGNLPLLNIALETGHRSRLSEDGSHDAHLNDIHSNFGSAYHQSAGAMMLLDGRRVEVREYVDGDVPELAAFIPEKGHVTAISMQVGPPADWARHRPAFEALLQSYRIESDAMPPALPSP